MNLARVHFVKNSLNKNDLVFQINHTCICACEQLTCGYRAQGVCVNRNCIWPGDRENALYWQWVQWIELQGEGSVFSILFCLLLLGVNCDVGDFVGLDKHRFGVCYSLDVVVLTGFKNNVCHNV